MAVIRIPPSRSLMCAAVYDEKTGQQPIVVKDKKLHVFPDWHNCYQNYQTTMVSSFGAITLTGHGSFTDTWRSPWETTVNMSKTLQYIFEIVPEMLVARRGLFGGESAQNEFDTFVRAAGKIWGVKFKYNKDRSLAYALCSSDAAPRGMNGDQFFDNAIKGSICFCTKVDCKDPDSTNGYNGYLKKLMTAYDKDVCYVTCEVDPEGLVYNSSNVLMQMRPESQKDKSMTEIYSYCVKGLRVFVDGRPVSLKQVAENIMDGDEMGNMSGAMGFRLRYMALVLKSKTNPTSYFAQELYATVGRSGEWDDDIVGKLPSSLPIRNYTTVKGKYWEELG